MRRIISILLIVETVILFQSTLCFAQDSSKIIILSSKVGATIDTEERDYYKLFQTYDGFNDAVIYQGTDSLFYTKITYFKGTSLKETSFIISYGLMTNWARRIEYFEELKKGDFKLGATSITLQYANGEIVRIPESYNKYIRISRYNFKKKLPLNEKKLDHEKLIHKDLELGVSFGIVHNSATFNGLGNIFNLLEENIPQDPYVVEKTKSTFKATPLFSFGVLGLYKNMIMAEIDYSLNTNSSTKSGLDYDSFIISVSYLFQFSQSILPYLSAGYMGYNFEAVKNYGVLVNDNQGRLESITIKGNDKGPVFGLGVLFNIDHLVNINLFGRYNVLGNPPIKQESRHNLADFETNVDMGGFEIGATLIFKY